MSSLGGDGIPALWAHSQLLMTATGPSYYLPSVVSSWLSLKQCCSSNCNCHQCNCQCHFIVSLCDITEGIVWEMKKKVKVFQEDWTSDKRKERISHILQLLSSLLNPPLEFFPTPVLVGVSGLPGSSWTFLKNKIFVVENQFCILYDKSIGKQENAVGTYGSSVPLLCWDAVAVRTVWTQLFSWELHWL